MRYALASVCGVVAAAGALRRARVGFDLRVDAALRGFTDLRAAVLRARFPLAPFDAFAPAAFGAPPIKNSSISCPAFKAAASQRGLRPRPAHVSLGLSGLRYLGATGPYPVPSGRTLPPELPKRESLLRVRLKTSSRIAELSQHEADGGELQEGEAAAVEIFPVLGEAAAAIEPSNRAFYDPTLG